MTREEDVLRNGIPTDSLVVVAQGFLNEAPGYSFRMMDGTRMFIPTTSEDEVAQMWKNITTAVRGNADFFLYYRSLINITLITEVLTKTEGVESPTLIIRFQDGFEFLSPYESLALMEKDYKEILALLCELNGRKAQTLHPSQLH